MGLLPGLFRVFEVLAEPLNNYLDYHHHEPPDQNKHNALALTAAAAQHYPVQWNAGHG
jgi:hypothetical protein